MLPVPRPSPTAGPRRYKLLVLGSSGVGKTSVIQRAIVRRAEGNQAHTAAAAAAVPPLPPPPPTLGCELLIQEETFRGDPSVLHIWDCSGADHYRPSLQHLYTPTPDFDAEEQRVHGAIFMYDPSDAQSFQSLSYWFNELARCVSPQPTILIVANKAEMGADHMQISAEDGGRQAHEWGGVHMSVSAKNGTNCEGLFTYMLTLIKKAQS